MLEGNLLRWSPSTGEDKLSSCRQALSGRGPKNPKVQGMPRTKGVEASHKLPKDSMETLKYRQTTRAVDLTW